MKKYKIYKYIYLKKILDEYEENVKPSKIIVSELVQYSGLHRYLWDSNTLIIKDIERYNGLADINLDDYYSWKRVKEILGNLNITTINKYISPVKYSTTNYYLKNEVNFYLELKNETMEAIEITKMCKYHNIEVVRKAIIKLKKEGKNVELVLKHPFGLKALVRGYEEVIKYVKKAKEYEDMNKFQRFLNSFNEVEIENHKAKKTLEQFCVFVKKRYDFASGRFKTIVYTRIYMCLLDNLEENIYKDVQANKIRKIIIAKHVSIDLEEFNMFEKWLLNGKFEFQSNKNDYGENVEDEYLNGYVSFPFLRNVCQRYMWTDDLREVSKILKGIKFYLRSLDIKYYETELNIYVLEADGLEFKRLYQNFSEINYYTKKQISDVKILGVNPITFQNYVKPIIFNTKRYFPKEKVLPYIEQKIKGINASELLKLVDKQSMSSLKVIIRKLKSQGKDVQLIKNSPCTRGFLVLGHEEVKKYIEYENILNSKENDYERVLFLIDELNMNNNKAKNTLKDFREFIKVRFNSTKRFNTLTYIRIYKNLVRFLSKEIISYTESEFQILFKIMKISGTPYKIDDQEFHNFLTYCNDEHRESLLPATIYSPIASETKKVNTRPSYTKVQWRELRKMVFERIDNADCLELAIGKRVYSMVWLYFALHFVQPFRTNDMCNLPFPDLNVIGFRNGDEFLGYLKNGGEFSIVDGEEVCNYMHLKMNAYGEKSEKNKQRLIFVVGKSMVRQVGLLLALAEAHRQTTKRKGANIDQLITGTVMEKKYHQVLFGKVYNEILHGEKFGNIKASSTFEKIIQEDGGELGLYIGGVARGHKVDFGEASSTNGNVYVTHGYNNSDRDLDRISKNMSERGVGSFAPYLMLNFLDSRFKKLSYEDQTHKIKKLNLSPLEIERLSKTIVQQESRITLLLEKILNTSSKKHIIKAIYLISSGKVPSKHQFSSCLLKAFISSGIKPKLAFGKNGLYEEQKCLYPEAITCFSCPYLICEKYFFNELNVKILGCHI